MFKNIFILSLILVSFTTYSQKSDGEVYFPDEIAAESNVIQNRLDIGEILTKADHLYNLEAFEDAVELYELVIRTSPYNAPAYFGRANVREQLGNVEGALSDYRIVHHLDPEMNEAYFNCAILEFNVGDFESAVPLFEKLLLLPEGTATQAIYFKGVQYSPNTAPVLSGISSLGGAKNALIHEYLGKCYDGLDEYTNSEKNYTEAISINPAAEIYLNRGIMRNKFNFNDGAITDFQKTLALDPDNSLAIYWLSMISQKVGEDSVSISALDKVLAGEHVFPEAYIHRGVLHLRSGNYKAAISDFDDAIKLSPDIPDAFVNRGLAKEKLDDLQGAILDLNIALNIDKDNFRAHQFRGNTYFKIGNYEAALKDYNLSISLDGNNPNLYYNRALTQNNLSQNSGSATVCEDLQRAIDLGMKAAIKTLEGLCR